MTTPVSMPAGHTAVAADFDALENLTGSWADWTTSFTWTSTGTQPALGNSVKEAKYIQVGKLVIATGSIVFGGTATYGTGNYLFSLPVTAATVELHCGTAYLIDQGTGTSRQPGACRLNTTDNFVINGSNGPISNTAPFTWTSTDRLCFTIIYEAA